MSSYSLYWGSIICTGDQDVKMLYIGFSRYSVDECVQKMRKVWAMIFDFLRTGDFENRGVKMVYISKTSYVIFVL